EAGDTHQLSLPCRSGSSPSASLVSSGSPTELVTGVASGVGMCSVPALGSAPGRARLRSGAGGDDGERRLPAGVTMVSLDLDGRCASITEPRRLMRFGSSVTRGSGGGGSSLLRSFCALRLFLTTLGLKMDSRDSRSLE